MLQRLSFLDAWGGHLSFVVQSVARHQKLEREETKEAKKKKGSACRTQFHDL